MIKSKSEVARELISSKKTFVFTSIAIALQAKMAEAAGFKAVSVPGAAVAAHILGLPDVGLITMTEMMDNIEKICNAVNIPVIADCDTGFGNAINTRRTVQSAIKAGASGLHIEDQVAPKRCGFTKGKELISEEEAIGKYRAAVDARNELDKNFLIIARTDARTSAGGSLKEAIHRAKSYREKGGVDAIYVEAVQSREEIKQIRAELDCPLTCSTHAFRPEPTISELEEMGINFLLGNTIYNVGNAYMWDMLISMKEGGSKVLMDWEDKYRKHPMVWPNYFDLVGFPQIQKWEKKYLPREAMLKYIKSQGIYNPQTRKLKIAKK